MFNLFLLIRSLCVNKKNNKTKQKRLQQKTKENQERIYGHFTKLSFPAASVSKTFFSVLCVLLRVWNRSPNILGIKYWNICKIIQSYRCMKVPSLSFFGWLHISCQTYWGAIFFVCSASSTTNHRNEPVFSGLTRGAGQFTKLCSTPQGSPGVGRNRILSSPHLCFITVFICDLFVSRDDPLMS